MYRKISKYRENIEEYKVKIKKCEEELAQKYAEMQKYKKNQQIYKEK